MKVSILTLLFLFCIFPLVSQSVEPAIFSQQIFQKWLDEVSEKIQKSSLTDHSGVIGWSKDGKIAVYEADSGWGPYGFCPVFLRIIDLVSDDQLTSGILVNFDSDNMIPQPDSEEIKRMVSELVQYGIRYSPASFHQSKLESSHELYEIKVNLLNKKQSGTICPGCQGEMDGHVHEEIPLYKAKGIIQIKKGTNQKTKTHQFELPVFAQFNYVGFCKSPFEERIVIVTMFSDYHYYALTDILVENYQYTGSSLMTGFK